MRWSRVQTLLSIITLILYISHASPTPAKTPQVHQPTRAVTSKGTGHNTSPGSRQNSVYCAVDEQLWKRNQVMRLDSHLTFKNEIGTDKLTLQQLVAMGEEVRADARDLLQRNKLPFGNTYRPNTVAVLAVGKELFISSSLKHGDNGRDDLPFPTEPVTKILTQCIKERIGLVQRLQSPTSSAAGPQPTRGHLDAGSRTRTQSPTKSQSYRRPGPNKHNPRASRIVPRVTPSIDECTEEQLNDLRFGHKNNAGCAEIMAAEMFFMKYPRGSLAGARIVSVDGRGVKAACGTEVTAETVGTPDEDKWGCKMFLEKAGIEEVKGLRVEDAKPFELETFAGGLVTHDHISLAHPR